MARLRRVRPGEDPGITREVRGRGVGYRSPEGRRVTAAERRRIKALVIPPAWSEVWICTDPQGHVQATGVDADGRRQYLYHPRWQQLRDRDKFERALDLAEAMPSARRRVTGVLRGEDLTRERVLAVAFRLLDLTAVRMGSRTALRRGRSRGLTTLQRRHAQVDGDRVVLEFRGKNRIPSRLMAEDPDLAAVMELLVAGDPRTVLLSWREGRRRRTLTPAALNAFVAEVTGGAFTAKDLRTLRGTAIAARTLAGTGAVSGRRARAQAELTAVRAAAAALGNTPAVARGSYIDPRVFSRYRRGRLMDVDRVPESALLDLLRG